MKAPNPMGCARCGIEKRGHAIQVGADGSHTWQQPTQQQIKERMHARRAGDVEASSDEESGQACVAARYGDRSLCGCMDCIEYTADQDGEYGC